MSLSTDTKYILECAMANKKAAEELAAAVDSLHAITAASVVAAFGTTTNLPAIVTGGTPDCSAAAIQTVHAVIETRLDNVEAKINAILASLKAASIMASA